MRGSKPDLQWRARGHAIGFGIGIATGEATVGRIGYEGRIDYTAIGPVVNLASRLCSSAADGQVIIDSATVAALGDALPVEPLGGRLIKGFAEPTAIFALVHTATGSCRCWRLRPRRCRLRIIEDPPFGFLSGALIASASAELCPPGRAGLRPLADPPYLFAVATHDVRNTCAP